MQLNMKDMSFTNFNKFMTPLYASPNIIQKAPRINYYLEDVFSLGVSFIQMAGPYTSEELATFALNGSNASHHADLVDQEEEEYFPRASRLIQSGVMPLLDMALNKCQSTLPYFHRQILRRMLAWDSEDRPTFIELKEIFQSPQVRLNFDNEGFVDSLIKDKINDRRNFESQR